jgi:hypothetical protein
MRSSNRRTTISSMLAVAAILLAVGLLAPDRAAARSPLTTTTASLFIYDAPTDAHVDACEPRPPQACTGLLIDAREGSLSPPGDDRGTSTTSPHSFVATEAGYTASKINITEEGLNKVFQTHLADGPFSAGKSLFNDNVTITRLIADADSVTPVVQSGSGNLRYIVDAGRVIGIDRATGQATSIYTVVTKSGGDLVTAFPGTP